MRSDKTSSSVSSASYSLNEDRWPDAGLPLWSGTEWQTPAPAAPAPLPGISTQTHTNTHTDEFGASRRTQAGAKTLDSLTDLATEIDTESKNNKAWFADTYSGSNSPMNAFGSTQAELCQRKHTEEIIYLCCGPALSHRCILTHSVPK